MARKPLLERADAPRFDAIVDEAVFRRGVTDPQIMVPQMRALIDLPEHVSLRVLPYSASWHAGTDGLLKDSTPRRCPVRIRGHGSPAC